ncbi:hypothetical protein P2B10_21660, partial [Xanthomonas perforans]
EVQERQAQQAQQQDPSQHSSQQADPQPHAPDAALAQQTPQPDLQQADVHQQIEAHNQEVGERAAHTTSDPRMQAPDPGDAQLHQAQEPARALETHALESRDAVHLQMPPSGDRESGEEPVQSAQSDSVSPALSRHMQTQPAEIEQASIRQQDMAREQEAAPVRVITPTTPASADPLIASQAAALTNPEQETKAEQSRPSDAPHAYQEAALLPAAHLAQAHEQSLEASAVSRSSVGAPDAENQRTQSSPVQERIAADPGGALFLEETMRSLRQLQQEIEAADREDERFHQEWREYRERGEPYPFAQKRALDQEGGSMDAFSAHQPSRRSPSEAAAQADAFPSPVQRFAGPGEGNATNDSSKAERKSITGDPDVDEVLYALDSKNELAIEQALNRVANSAATQALIKRGNEFLEAQAQQEAQELAATRQALGMDVSAEINTSRGPVMVMTLPEFAKGPMQSGPQGDGG